MCRESTDDGPRAVETALALCGGSRQEQRRGQFDRRTESPRSPVRLTRRRAVLAGVGSALLGTVLPADWFTSTAQYEPSVASGAWPAPQRDPARSGYSPTGGAPTAPEVAWTETATRGLPVAWVVARGRRVYAATRRSLAAFDAATGRRQWRTQSLAAFGHGRPVRLREGPHVGERVVIAVGDTLYALDPTTGEPQWQTALGGSHRTMLRVGRTAVVGVGEGIVGVDTESGLRRWRHGGGLRPSVFADSVVVGPSGSRSKRAQLVALDPQTGSERWRRELAAAWRPATGACATRSLVVTGTNPVVAYRLTDGEPQWEAAVEGLAGPLATDGDRVYAVAGDAERLLAVDATDGNEQWRRRLPGLVGGVAPIVADETVYATTTQGVLALDRRTGALRYQLLLRSDADDTVRTGPVAAGGRLFVALGREIHAVTEGSDTDRQGTQTTRIDGRPT